MALSEDYSSKDFIDVYEELLEIVEASTTKWDPRHSTEADPGVVLLKLIALLEDKHQYRSDMARNQGFLDTVTDKQSAYELLEMLGYIMKQARCATGQITLVPANISSAWEEGTTVTVPRFTIITDSTSTYKFFTLNETSFSGTTIVNATSSAERNTLVNVQAGEPFQITKDGSSLFSLKDVDEDGRLYLGYSNLAQNGVFVYTAVEDEEGNITETENSWTYIDFSILKPVAQWYTIGTSTNNETYIQFPDDFESLIGTSTFTVYGTYTEGSGSNISANVLSTFYDSTYSNYFTVKQTNAFTNGQNSETIAQARENYYNTVDVCNTLVSASDFRAAIKSIVCNLTASNTGFVKGEKYFSNAIIRTAKDRKINTRSVAYGTGYDLFIPDTTEPSDQIDVVGLRNSNTYSESFQRIDKAAEIAQVKADLEDQLEDSTSIDVSINMDEDYPRLLAVTTPDLTVRISNYTDTLATTIKSEIINYFQSTYSAGNVTAGEGFDYQTIVDDIKDLNSNILSVSMRDLTYTIYSKFKEVDDVDSVLASDTTLSYRTSTTTVDYAYDTNGNISSTTTTTTENVESINLQIDAAARVVVAGDIPLFRYYNRQNTLTKQLSGYSTLASISDTTDNLESVITVPIAATSYEQLGPVDSETGVSESYAPEITSLKFLPFDSTGLIAGTGSNYNTTAQYADLLPKSATATDGSYLYSNFTLGTNHLLQIRVPQHTASESYGYGYCYLLYGHKLGVKTTIYTTSALEGGTKLVGTSDAPLTIVGYFEVLGGWTDYESDSDGNVTKINSRGPNATTTIDGETAYIYNNVTVSLSVQEGNTLTILKGSVLTADSEIAIGSTLNGETYTPLAAADGEEYQIQSGETLVLYKSSNTNTRVEKTGGTWIQPSGFDLYFVTSTATEGTVLGSTSSIAFLTDDSCYITDEFVYFLSLRSSQETLTITESGYMLEEDETFIYANQAVTEYVELGPGTVLRPTNSSGSVTLKNTPYTTLEEVSTSMFNDFASGDSIEAQAYELTTWGEGKGVLLHNSDAIYGAASTYMAIPTTFSSPGNNIVEVYSEEVVTDSTGSYWATSDDNLLATYTGNNYEIRLVVRLESDDNGLIEIAYPVELTISTDGTEDHVVRYSGSDSETQYLVTSTPVSGVFQAISSGSSDTQLLYSPGVTGRIGLATADETAVSDGASVSQDAQSVTVTTAASFLVDPAATEKLIVRFPIALVTVSNLGVLDCLLRVTIDFDDFKLLKSEEDALVFKICSKTGGTDSSGNVTYSVLSGADVGIYGVDGVANLESEASILLYEKGEYGVTLYIHCAEAFDSSTTPDDFIYLEVYWQKISSGSSYTESGDYEGITFTFSDLSYIYGFSSELQADSSIDDSISESEKWVLSYYSSSSGTGRYAENSTEDKLVDRIQELNIEGRYDYLTMPSETYEHPTISSSYLESNHPYNDAVFPYLYLVSSKIKVIKGR